jgi:hypothetical protein
MHSNDVARLGAGAAAIALADRTKEVQVFKGDYAAQYRLQCQNKHGDPVILRPKTKRKSDVWQESINVEVGNYTVWMMVDLADELPEFYLAPAQWMVDMIRLNHRKYIDTENPSTGKVKGHRARTETSDHTAFGPAQIAQWKDAWWLLDDPSGALQPPPNP